MSNEERAGQREKNEAGSFTGDVPGGGQGQDTDLGRDGSSTPTGDVGTARRRPEFPQTPGELLDEPHDPTSHRSSTNLVPGVPEGDGSVPELDPLEGTRAEDRPAPDKVRRDDQDRTTL